MGCNCGGSGVGEFFLVTRADGTRCVVDREPAARIAVVMAGGGTWRKVTPEQAAELRREGVHFD